MSAAAPVFRCLAAKLEVSADDRVLGQRNTDVEAVIAFDVHVLQPDAEGMMVVSGVTVSTASTASTDRSTSSVSVLAACCRRYSVPDLVPVRILGDQSPPAEGRVVHRADDSGLVLDADSSDALCIDSDVESGPVLHHDGQDSSSSESFRGRMVQVILGFESLQTHRVSMPTTAIFVRRFLKLFFIRHSVPGSAPREITVRRAQR